VTLRSAIRAALLVFLGQLPRHPARILTAVTVFCGGIGAALLVVHPEQWMVEQVVFEGQRRSSVAELRHLADLPNGTLVWEVDLERVEAGVAQHPWVDRVEAEWVWPALAEWGTRGPGIQITVSERRAVALLHEGAPTSGGGGRLWCVDDEGQPFLPGSAHPGGDAAGLDLPHLVGFGRELGALHPELQRRAIRTALWLIAALDERGLVPRDAVSEVVFDRDAGMLVVAGPARITFGHADLPVEVDRLATLVGRGVSLDVPTAIDLASPSVALVRPLSPVGPSSGG
jgi:hypothetical protein